MTWIIELGFTFCLLTQYCAVHGQHYNVTVHVQRILIVLLLIGTLEFLNTVH